MMLLLAVVWGLSIPVTKLGLQTMPPLTLTALRSAIAVPFLALFTLGRPKMAWRSMPKVAALGVLGIGLGQVAQSFGIVDTSASIATMISATIPVFVVIFAAARLKQGVSRWQKLGLLAAFLGIALVAVGNGRGIDDLLGSSAVGAAWVLLSAVTIAFYYVWSLELCDAYGTATVAAWSTFFGFLALCPFSGLEMWYVPIHLTPQALAVAAYLGLAVTIAGLFIWLHLLRTVPAPIAASVQFLQPVVGVIASAVVFGDTMGPLFAVGVVMVLVGLALSAIPKATA